VVDLLHRLDLELLAEEHCLREGERFEGLIVDGVKAYGRWAGDVEGGADYCCCGGGGEERLTGEEAGHRCWCVLKVGGDWRSMAWVAGCQWHKYK